MRKKDERIIPVIVQPLYQPSDWLEPYTFGSLDFSHPDNFEFNYSQLQSHIAAKGLYIFITNSIDFLLKAKTFMIINRRSAL